MPGVTREQIEQARRMTAIEYLLKYEAYDLKRCGAGEYELRSHDSFKISEHTSKWHWKSRDIGGVSALDFLVRVREQSFIDTVRQLCMDSPMYIPLVIPEKPRKVFALPEKAPDSTRAADYLRNRGISVNVLHFCHEQGLFYEDLPYHNVVFVARDKDGKPRFAAKRGTWGQDYKRDVAGGEKRYGCCIQPEGTSDTVAVYESIIDAMSHASIREQDGLPWHDKYRLAVGGIYAPKREMLNLALAGRDDDILVVDPENEYAGIVRELGGEVIRIAATSRNHINAMDMVEGYGDGENPIILKSEFILSLCEQLVGNGKLSAKEKSLIDRCTANVYRQYLSDNYRGLPPTLQDFHAELIRQDEPEARDVALAIELFTSGSLNTFAQQTNVNPQNRIVCYDIRDLGKQLLPIGMLVVLDSIFNRVVANRLKGKNTWIIIDEIYLLFQHEYSANFLYALWKRVRKYGACATGLTQNIDDLLQSHTARTMLANSEYLVMLNQAATDRIELAKLLNISENQLSYITNVPSGHGLLKCGSNIVPFEDRFPTNTRMYQLMTTKPNEKFA